MRLRLLMSSLAVALITLAAAGQPANASSGAPGFTAGVVMPNSSGGTEPYVAITRTETAINPLGYRYTTWQSPGQFAGSPDGQNFTYLTTPDPNALGDTSDQVDAAGSLYNGQICGPPAALHTCIYRSDDGGHTWPVQTQAADVNPGASDRPWFDVYPKTRHAGWDPNHTLVFLEYHTFSPEDLTYATISTDGGQTFSPPVPLTTDQASFTGSFCSTVPSGVVADQRHPGTFYTLWLSPNDPVSNLTTGCNYTQAQVFNKAWVSKCTVGTVPPLTCSAQLAWQGNYDPTTGIGDNASKIFGTISMDDSGQLDVILPVRFDDDVRTYVTTGQEQPRDTRLVFVASPDAGTSWTAPFIASKNCKGSHFFPWVVGGSAGRLDIVFYHSDSQLPNDPSDKWFTGFIQVTNARAVAGARGTASFATAPRVHVVEKVEPTPEHLGGICTYGIFCSVVNGNRGLADSISIALDPDGGANLIWTDDANRSATPEIEFACQNTGESAYASKPPLDGCYRPIS